MFSTLIIFTRDEIEGISRLFPCLPITLFDEAFAIDGHSTDGTTEFLRGKGLRVYSQKRMGRAEATLEAMEIARGDAIVLFSGDGNEDPDCIPRLLDLIQSNDMVVASRFTDGGRSDDTDDPLKLRRILSIAIAKTVSILWRVHVTDATNGLRAVRRSLWDRCHVTADYHTVELTLTIQASKLKARMAEIPTIEGRRAGHARYASTWKMAKSLSNLLLREIFSR